jgi:NADPH:quinone reductase-like Zn-dependent oxidoreductase
MKAVVIVPRDGQDRPTLDYRAVADPSPQPTELLVAVRAAGINRIDLARSTAHGSPEAGRPLIAGLEMAGEVIGVGSEVSGFNIGEKVMGMTTAAYAEMTTIDYRLAMRMPPSFSFDQAAAVSVVYPTAHDALVTNGQFTAGKSILIQGAASAVGVATLQMAKVLGAAKIIGTGRPSPKADKLIDLGLDRFLVKDADDTVAAVMCLTNGRGVDVVIDMVGGSALAANVDSTCLGGRIVNVGWMGGKRGEIDLDTLARKRLSLVGVSFRTRSLEQRAVLFSRFRHDIYPLFESGTLRPLIHATYPLSEASRAQDAMALDQHLGKIILHP